MCITPPPSHLSYVQLYSYAYTALKTYTKIEEWIESAHFKLFDPFSYTLLFFLQLILELKRSAVSDLTFPGFAPPGRMTPWWFAFHPDIPEALVQGTELMYLSWFYHNLAYNPGAITQADINEFVSHYSDPGGMRAGFEYYRAFPQDAIENQNYSKTKLTIPVLAVYGSYYPTFVDNVTINPALYSMKALAQNVRGIQIPNSGHWSPEERP